jgi:hypothetical protein
MSEHIEVVEELKRKMAALEKRCAKAEAERDKARRQLVATKLRHARRLATIEDTTPMRQTCTTGR